MNDIRPLIQKFFNGETTLDEEQRLYDYFSQQDIADDLLPLKQMFADLGQIQKPCAVNVRMDSSAIIPRRSSIAVAAAVTIAVALSTMLHFSAPPNYELSVYGKTYTQQEVVMCEVDRTMGSAIQQMPDVEGELRQAFGNN